MAGGAADRPLVDATGIYGRLGVAGKGGAPWPAACSKTTVRARGAPGRWPAGKRAAAGRAPCAQVATACDR